MTITVSGAGNDVRPTAGEVVPLRDRIAYMESLRAAVGRGRAGRGRCSELPIAGSRSSSCG